LTSLHFFPDPADLRRWLEANHDTANELWVALYKKASGRPSITWPQLVDELLCFGWIDGLRRSVDDASYSIRITPRKPTSIWSDKNTQRVQELIESGRMTPAGLAAFGRREPERSGVYSFENDVPELGEAYEADLRANAAAWQFFQSQPPSYRRTATAWVISAKREETRRRRLATLIEDSANGLRIGPLRRSGTRDGRHR
jgi:uncharacterized protein YdeI (YjbR/CyaY-like superfamily)